MGVGLEEACTEAVRDGLARVPHRLGGGAAVVHGIGLAKRPYFLRQTAKENLQAMNAIKTALDPQHILNNGKSYLTGGNNNAGTF